MNILHKERFGLSLWRLNGYLLLGMFLCIAAPRAVLASVNATAASGDIIYSGGSYFYGPSIINDSAGMHVFACSPGSGGAWDYIRYQLSTNGGVTFGSQSIVLEPTPGSPDSYSTCDPGVIEFGGYYYIGYTSTANANGTQNNVFVARSTSITGPFDKWNGTGWGGSPVPFITYTGNPVRYGAGEPSFVVVGNTLYIYYTWYDTLSNGTPTQTMRVATASTTNANWPGSITYQGVGITKRPDQNQDSSDVKYVDAYSKFIAVNTAQRFGPKAYIQMWESTNGITFTPSNLGRDNFLPYLHNDGLTGDSSGHINVSTAQDIGYAYGSIWGDWNTYLNPVTFTNDALPGKVDIYSVDARNGEIRLEFQTNSSATSYTVKYGTVSGTYTNTVTGVSGSPYTLTGLTNGTKYFVVVAAVNSSGTGAVSSQVAAVPQNYQLLTASTASASSSISGWPVSNVIDGNFTTNYSSNGHGSASATEWVEIDYGSDNIIGKLVLGDVQYDLQCAPMLDNNLDAQIQVSSDGSTWFDADYRLNTFPIIDDDGFAKTVVTFPQPLYGRYIRIYSTKLSDDSYGNYYLQIGEVQAYTLPVVATASTTLSGWPPSSVLDLDQNTVFSAYPTDPTPWVEINLGSKQLVSGVNLTPRAGGWCFPIAFSIQYSTDGSTFTTVPGQSYTGYPNPGSNTQPFTFATPVQAQYIRVQATQLSKDPNGNPYFQIAGMYIRQTIPFTATASTQIAGWAVSGVADAVPATMWSSTSHSSANSTEWVQIDMGASYRVQDLRLAPRDGYCFPSAFTITYSTDGSTWTQVPGQVYTAFANPALAGTTPNPQQLMWFSTPVTARYFKITATTLTPDQYNNYYFQLTDIFVDQ